MADRDVDVQIQDYKEGQDTNIFPVTKAYNIIVSEDPLITLNQVLDDQTERNVKYDEGMEKLTTIERGAEVNQRVFQTILVNDDILRPTNTVDTLDIILGDNLEYSISGKTFNIDAKPFTKIADSEHSGLMSAEMVRKFDTIEDNANFYEHPKSEAIIENVAYNRVYIDKNGHAIAGFYEALPVTDGGTGATNAADAKRNLEIIDPHYVTEITEDGVDYPPVAAAVWLALQEKADVEHGDHVPESSEEPDEFSFLHDGNMWSPLPIANLESMGIVQLSSDTESDDENMAATPAAIHKVQQNVESIVRDAFANMDQNTEKFIQDLELYQERLNEFNGWIDSHEGAYQEILEMLSRKVDQMDGKGLSTFDFTQDWIDVINITAENMMAIREEVESTARTIQKNGEILESVNGVVNIIVPTALSQLTDDIGVLRVHPIIPRAESAYEEETLEVNMPFSVVSNITYDSNGHIMGTTTKVYHIEIADRYPNPVPLGVAVEDTIVGAYDGSNPFYLNLKTASDKLNITSSDDEETVGCLNVAFDLNVGNASTIEDGFMSKEDKTKLEGIAVGANKYFLPTAGIDQLGGVMTISRITDPEGLSPVPIIDGIPYYKEVSDKSDILRCEGTSTIVGDHAGANMDITLNNTIVGCWSGASLTMGNKNTFVGYYSGNGVEIGICNTLLGRRSGEGSNSNYNVAVGERALSLGGSIEHFGDYNTAIGFQALYDASSNSANFDGFTNCTGVGYAAMVTGSNQVQLGNSNTTVYGYNAFQNRSDERDKTDIHDTDLGLEFINRLRPVKFRWNYRDDYIDIVDKGNDTVEVIEVENDGSRARKRFHEGFSAQQVKSVMDELGVDFAGYQDHSINGGKDVLSLGYSEFIGPIVKSIQELNDKINMLQKIIHEQDILIDSLINHT